jgi:hypothetical protein
MKTSMFILLVFFVAGNAIGQMLDPSKVPASVKSSFSKNFPGNDKVSWELENGNYEASYKQDNHGHSALFSPGGSFLESEIDIKVGELPPAATAYMDQHYTGILVKEAARVTKASGEINYEAGIKGKDVIFDANGKFIKEEKD